VTFFALIFSIVIGDGSLAWGYAQVGLPQFSRWIVLFGALWLVMIWRRWRWFAYIGLVFNFFVAAMGLWMLNFPPGWMFAGAIGGLMAWDLTDFHHRLRFAADEERPGLETRHLLRISVLAALGFGIASIAMIVKWQFNFDWALLLAIIAAFGVLQLVVWLRKRR
jgi:hypothetical protein